MAGDKKWLWIGLAVLAFFVIAAIMGIMIYASLNNPGETTTDGSTAEDTAIVELVYNHGTVVHQKVDDFDAFIQNADVPVFVDFWAPWCGPCKLAAPFVESLAKDYAGKAHILKVDVDQAGSLAQKYNIQSIPTFIVIKQGEVKGNLSGYSSAIEKDIRQMLDEQLN